MTSTYLSGRKFFFKIVDWNLFMFGLQKYVILKQRDDHVQAKLPFFM